ncbi:MAG: hypothetical protein V1698_01945, partial [bacterium]
MLKINQKIKKLTLNKTIAFFLAATFIFQIIFGGIVLQVKQANAIPVIPADSWATIGEFIWDIGGKQVWDAAKWVYEKAYYVADLAADTLSSIADGISSFVDTWTKNHEWLAELLKIAWNVLRKKFFDMLVNTIIDWIQGGKGGSTKFVTDWKKFLGDVANEAGGMFIEGSDLAWLCDSFSTQIKIALGTVPPFKEKVSCTLDEIADNINDYYGDMRAGGGWDGWLKVTQRSNNVFGAYFDVQGEKLSREMKATEALANEAISGSGFLGDKICKEWGDCDEQMIEYCEGDGLPAETCKEQNCQCKKWESRTPGKVMADAVSKATTMDLDWLISSDDYTEYVAAILDAVIIRVTKEGLALTQTDENGKNGSYSSRGMTSEERGLQAQYENMNDLANQMSQGDLDQAAATSGYGDKIDIANRQGQRQLMLGFKNELREVKQNIKKVFDYLREQEENVNALDECTNTKYDLCLGIASDKISASLSKKPSTISDDGNGNPIMVIVGTSIDEFCASKKLTCAETDPVKQLICQEEKYSACISEAKSLLKEKFENYCYDPNDVYTISLQEQAESAEWFKEYLNTHEQLIQYEKTYTNIDMEIAVTDEILQKLEKYKPFDECIEKNCSAVSDFQTCKNEVMAEETGICFTQEVTVTALESYNPFLVCAEDNCGSNPTSECYVKITSTTGACAQFMTYMLTYSELTNNPKSAITEENIKLMQEIQEVKQQDYFKIISDISSKSKQIPRQDEECLDGTVLPKVTANEYELTHICTVKAMQKCAPIPSMDRIVSEKIWYSFIGEAERRKGW